MRVRISQASHPIGLRCDDDQAKLAGGGARNQRPAPVPREGAYYQRRGNESNKFLTPVVNLYAPRIGGFDSAHIPGARRKAGQKPARRGSRNTSFRPGQISVDNLWMKVVKAENNCRCFHPDRLRPTLKKTSPQREEPMSSTRKWLSEKGMQPFALPSARAASRAHSPGRNGEPER